MAPLHSPLLGDLSAEQFLNQYWQKKPCILRSVIDPKQLQILSVDELAGYALDENVESRLIQGRPGEKGANSEVKFFHGPFSEEQLAQLPEQDWTLLIQSLDIWNEDFRNFLDWVDFIPRWRLDDIMVSIAAPGGGVGPHRDQYDVFLIQCEGEREWQVSPPDQQEDIICQQEILQVASFEGEMKQTFEAGDVLYLPPGWRHWGVANSLSITCSIGFRAPATEELLISLSDQVNQQANNRFNDQWRTASKINSITTKDIAQVRSKLQDYINDDYKLAEALGIQVTQTKFDLDMLYSAQQDASIDISEANVQQLKINLLPASRMTYVKQNKNLILFVNGESLTTHLPEIFAQQIDTLCSHHQLVFEKNKDHLQLVVQFIVELNHIGAIEINH